MRKQHIKVIATSVDVDLAIADGAGEYLRRFRKSHALSIGDAVIAATAKEMGMKLVTRNIQHYPMKDIDIVKTQILLDLQRKSCYFLSYRILHTQGGGHDYHNPVRQRSDRHPQSPSGEPPMAAGHPIYR